MNRSATPLIELDRVTLVRAGSEILSDVNWSLQHREHWAVLGPNGGGKTSLLRVVCGYAWPNRGTVRRMGRELIDLAQLRRRISWVAGEMAPEIPPEELAIETVVSGRFPMVGLRRLPELSPTDDDFTKAERLLASMNCDALADKPFGVLSHGERQQTLVARARMLDPLLVVLDEPCAGMDPGVRERFLVWLEETTAAPDSPTTVLVTHHVEEITPSFTSTLLIKAGRVLATGATADILTADRLAELYDTTVERIETHRGRHWPIWGADRAVSEA